MSIQIRDLAPELQELCHKRQIEQGNDGTFNGDIDNGMRDDNFNWDETEEGDNFWEDIYEGKDVTNHPMYPTNRTINYEIY